MAARRFPPDAILRVPDHVLMRKVGEEMVMLNLHDESYYGLNDVGMRLMQLAGDGIPLQAILAALAQEFEVEGKVLEADLQRMVAELVAAELLTVAPT